MLLLLLMYVIGSIWYSMSIYPAHASTAVDSLPSENQRWNATEAEHIRIFFVRFVE